MSADSFTDINVQEPYFKAVKTVFDNWTALQLALTHNFAGGDTKETSEWFLNTTYQWIVENNDLEDFELEDFFEETLNTEFNMLLEDNSAIQIARLLLNYRQLVCEGKWTEMEQELTKRFPVSGKKNQIESSVKIKSGDQDRQDESSSSGEEDEEDGEEIMDANNNEEPSKPKSKISEEDMEKFEQMDEGWTLVTKSGKQLTK